MSIILEPEAEARALVVHLSGKIHAEDYKEFVPVVERAVQLHGKVAMLVLMHDFHGWTPGAMWQDVKFDAKYFNRIDKLAVVGETKWQEWLTTFCRPFTTARVRYFTPGQMSEARQWLGLTQEHADHASAGAPH